ncbi:hypothetical protein BJ165DRAFT_202866 [Panaeolus papilionaceus]|nr:hypothetical protein BJ165DRAFT_202866 [Panaeolus papilionaceus]
MFGTTTLLMEKVLQNDYLVDEILQKLYCKYAPNNSTLYRAALVCRAFRRPAEGLLWRNLKSILPILKLLPSIQYRADSKLWYLDGPICEEDVDNMFFVTARVRTLYTVLDVQVEPATYLLLSCALGSRSLLPNLTDLFMNRYWYQNTNEQCSMELQLLLSTRLRDITINYAEPTQQSSRQCSIFIQRLASLPIHHLGNLSISGVFPSAAVLSAVRSFRKLSNLRLDKFEGVDIVMDCSFFQSPKGFENLSSLSISMSSFDWGSLEPTRWICLPGLTHLSLNECSVRQCTNLLKSLRLGDLRKFALCFTLPDHTQPHDPVFPWNALFDALKACRLSTSPTFSLDLSPMTDGQFLEFEHDTIQDELLERYPGLACHAWEQCLSVFKFEELHLRFPMITSLSNTDLHKVAGIWPNLTSLTLRTTSSGALDTSALEIIAKGGFRLLRNLALDVVTNVVTDPPICGEHDLRTLDINLLRWSPREESIQRLAALVDALFPFLSCFSGKRAEQADDVSIQIQELQNARARERRRLALRSSPQ